MTAPQPHLSHPKYRPDIDGLRAIAVLAVVAFHAFPDAMKGGFIGVDIFFVISGFLISTIIFENLDRGTFSFGEFYARRVKRIFPALLLVLGLCLVAGWFALLAEEYRQLGKHIAAGAGFISNLVLWSESGYFDSAAETKPLLHLWSLGIEEQFYIVWPLLAWLAWKRRFNLVVITVSVALLSFALNAFDVKRDAIATFYSPQTRFWELLCGSLLAWYTLYGKGKLAGAAPADGKGGWGRNGMSLAGLALLAAGLLVIDRHFAFPGGWALVPVTGAVLLIASGPHAWVNRLLLSNPVAVWFGLISFPLYLWHWPLLAFPRVIEAGMPERNVRLAAVALAVLLAWLTTRFVERPLRFGTRGTLKVAILATTMAAVGAIGVAVHHVDALSRTRLAASVDPEIVKAMGDWEFPGGLRKASVDGLHVYRNSTQPPEAVLFGDSHIEQYGPRIAALADMGRARSVALITGEGCPPIPGVHELRHPQCDGLTERFEGYLRAHPSVTTVLIGACWNCYFIDQTAAVSATEDVYRYTFRGPTQLHAFRGGDGKLRSLEALGAFIARLREDYAVYVLLDNPSGKAFDPAGMLGGGRSRRAITLALRSAPPATQAPPTFSRDPGQVALEAELSDLVATAGATPLAPSALICPGGTCARSDAQGRPIYKDDNHIRPFFARERMNVIDPIVALDDAGRGLAGSGGEPTNGGAARGPMDPRAKPAERGAGVSSPWPALPR